MINNYLYVSKIMKIKCHICFVIFFIYSWLQVLYSQNPILRGYADPHMKVYNGRMYISVGKDIMPQKGSKDFFIYPWEIYSSDDLLTWKRECIIDPSDTYLGEGYNRCWASDITTKDGKYYFYFSNHAHATGVLVGDSPCGPYKDVLGHPMIPKEYSFNHEYDPTVFVDDDGSQYIVFGMNGMLQGKRVYYQIARISSDMLSMAEKSKDLLTPDGGFGLQRAAQDHQYFHKHNGIYYLSCAGAYLTSDSVYGPFNRLRHCGQNGHSSFCEFNGQWYHMYEWACEPYGIRQYRQICLTYLHYKDNGDMVSDPNFLQASNVASEGKYYKTGVGNYMASWPVIEAEWYFKRMGKLIKKECPNGGFEIQNIFDSDYLVFPYVNGMKENSAISFNVSSKSSSVIEVREDNPHGTLLGTCLVSPTGSWKKYKHFTVQLKNNTGVHSLCFLFKGKSGELMRLDNFRLY